MEDSEVHPKGYGKMKHRHKLELKVLRNRWQSSLSKEKDKKKRRELELQFKEEEKALINTHKSELNENVDCNGFRVDDVEMKLELYPKDKEGKLSKRQMKKNRRRQIELEKRLLIEKEMESLPKLGELELSKINERLRRENLKIESVASDGHCMYRALENQLRIAEKVENCKKGETFDFTYMKLREIAADFILKNQDTYQSFLDEIFSNESFFEYCTRIKETAEWGGEVELQALAEALQRLIVVYTADDVLKYGEHFNCDYKLPLRLSYHRSLMCLGSHYNAVVPIDCTTESDLHR